MTKGWNAPSIMPITAPAPPHMGGRYYGNFLNLAAGGTLVVSANVLYAVPVFVPLRNVYTQLGVSVSTFAAGNVQLGIYNDGGGLPTTLVLDAGNVSTGATNDYKLKTISQALTTGWYWLAGVFDATPTMGALTRASKTMPQLGFTSGTDITSHLGYSGTFTYGALPAAFSSTGSPALMTTDVPIFLIGL